MPMPAMGKPVTQFECASEGRYSTRRKALFFHRGQDVLVQADTATPDLMKSAKPFGERILLSCSGAILDLRPRDRLRCRENL